MKPGDTPLARLSNWSILSPLLTSFGLEIDADVKSLIVVGGALAVGLEAKESKQSFVWYLVFPAPSPLNLYLFADTEVVVRLLLSFYDGFGEELSPSEPVDTLPPRAQPPMRPQGDTCGNAVLSR